MKRVDRKLGKYDIKLVHFIPGRIRLQSAEWKVNDILLENIIKQSQAQPFLFSVQSTKETHAHQLKRTSKMKVLSKRLQSVQHINYP